MRDRSSALLYLCLQSMFILSAHINVLINQYADTNES